MVELSGSGRLIASEKVDQLYRECRMKLVEEWSRLLKKEASVIDVGAGNCFYSYHLSEAGFNVIALDIDRGLLTTGSKQYGFKGEKIIADATRMPFLDNSFDGAICIEVIEHVERPNALLEEISRILKLGSPLLLTTPNGGRPIRKLATKLGVDIRVSPFHKTEYTLSKLLRMIKAADFEIDQVFCYALDIPTPILRLLPKFLLRFLITPKSYKARRPLEKFLGVYAHSRG